MRIFIVLFFIINQSFSNEIGTWKDYYSYNGAKKVFYQNYQAYCVTNKGLFSYNNELFLYNKLNFTSDYGINNLAFGSNKIIISYENSKDIVEVVYSDIFDNIYNELSQTINYISNDIIENYNFNKFLKYLNIIKNCIGCIFLRMLL